METNEIIENNKLITTFMEVKETTGYYDSYGEQMPHYYTTNGLYRTMSYDIPDKSLEIFKCNSRYHESWDWLAPVLEKICRMKIGDGKTYVEYAYPRTFGMLNEEAGQIMVRLTGYPVFEADTLIKATYLAIIDFIKWYNGKDFKNQYY